ncbi:hypothetical protein GYMLUDRAFT_51323 [Collybiopsis luxurians FD-317 M1]|uniref:Uncharacterized protein n=1 Tax=Collybiopsis luxurians FD-317 M1 TaxID=944289 RepID=A0A0D0AJ95_9AGAR|nr:hypothetical protein GYMLUDRAFT_51323 [Collybiopsis luxurians FD-317 M1]
MRWTMIGRAIRRGFDRPEGGYRGEIAQVVAAPAIRYQERVELDDRKGGEGII